ncbi:hypothetical protein FGO68_gene9491 [Halteria grandinella]|uniref:Uncharacterized protein n=1 Tax=Halteria grandinella TaxID=5974 RepID=A0A8J8NUK7_HALGN|nr:hypothetical protein FGO68_gene9491 [Halteria grandinella]
MLAKLQANQPTVLDQQNITSNNKFLRDQENSIIDSDHDDYNHRAVERNLGIGFESASQRSEWPDFIDELSQKNAKKCGLNASANMKIKEDGDSDAPCSRIDSLRKTFARVSEAKIVASGETHDTNYLIIGGNDNRLGDQKNEEYMRQKSDWSSPKKEDNVKMENAAQNRIIPQTNATVQMKQQQYTQIQTFSQLDRKALSQLDVSHLKGKISNKVVPVTIPNALEGSHIIKLGLQDENGGILIIQEEQNIIQHDKSLGKQKRIHHRNESQHVLKSQDFTSKSQHDKNGLNSQFQERDFASIQGYKEIEIDDCISPQITERKLQGHYPSQSIVSKSVAHVMIPPPSASKLSLSPLESIGQAHLKNGETLIQACTPKNFQGKCQKAPSLNIQGKSHQDAQYLDPFELANSTRQNQGDQLSLKPLNLAKARSTSRNLDYHIENNNSGSVSPAASFAAANHFDWYHKERQALYEQRASEAKRRDLQGVPIAKAIGKRHKIVFRDQVVVEEGDCQKKLGLEIVHLVENYKEFNVMEKNQKKSGTNSNCACLIF